MVENKKYKLLFRDRIGIVFDITKLMLEHKLNIISMEVEQKEGFAQISVEIEGDIPLALKKCWRYSPHCPESTVRPNSKDSHRKKEKNGSGPSLTA